MSEFGSYGILEYEASEDRASSVEVVALLEEIRVRGFGALRGVIDGLEVDRLNARMDEIYLRQCAEVGGEDALLMMNDADIVRCPLSVGDDYLRLAMHPLLLEVARAVLGDSFVLLMQNGVINRPDRRQFQSNWHRDLNYQHWVCSRPIALSALVCLEDFNVETGGTAFLPGSHMFEHFPSQEIVAATAVTPDLPRGSIILFNSMVFHRAGVNTSGRIRRAVNHVLGVPILAQQVDIPTMLNREPPRDAWTAGYLGYRWNPMRDVASWRRKRIKEARERIAVSDVYQAPSD